MRQVLLTVIVLILSCGTPARSQEKKTLIDLSTGDKAAAGVKELWKPVNDANESGNLVAAAAHKKKAEAAFNSSIGNSVDRNVKILLIAPEGIKFAHAGRVLKDGKFLASAISIHPSTGKNGKATNIKRGFPVSDEPWVLNLKSGDTVRVRGRIAATGHEGDIRGAITVALFLSDYKLSPVEAK
jgi:hypothetical protein